MKHLFYALIPALLLSPIIGPGFALLVVIGLSLILTVAAPKKVALVIPIADSTALITTQMVAIYREMIDVPSFLRSFFPSEFVRTRDISIAVRRGKEKVAVDVLRYAEGNRNSFNSSTEKLITPPYYKEFMIANDHRLYDVVIFSLMQNDTNLFSEMTAEMAEDMMELQKKIERSIEIQCANILETGVISLNSVTDIDFKRKAASLVDKGVGNYWATGTVNPYTDLENGCKFLRQVGKATGSTFNVIMGTEAYTDFLNNDVVKERADIRNFVLDRVSMPQGESTGAVFHGEVAAGAYRVRIWTYPEYYDNDSNVSTAYIPEKKVIIIPENPRFVTKFGIVPQLIQNGSVPQTSEYLIRDFIDNEATAHKMQIEAAPVAVPVAVDQVYTVQVVAD